MGQSLLLRPDGTVPVRGAAFKGFGLSGILHDHERSPWNSGFGKTQTLNTTTSGLRVDAGV